MVNIAVLCRILQLQQQLHQGEKSNNYVHVHGSIVNGLDHGRDRGHGLGHDRGHNNDRDRHGNIDHDHGHGHDRGRVHDPVTGIN